MLGLECLLHVACHALLANNFRILSNWTVLKSGISSFTLFLPFPDGRKVDLALRTPVRLLRWVRFFVLRQIVHHVLEPEQIHELDVARVRHKVHLRRWRFRWWNLEQSFLQLFAQCQLGGCLPLCLALWVLAGRLVTIALQRYGFDSRTAYLGRYWWRWCDGYRAAELSKILAIALLHGRGGRIGRCDRHRGRDDKVGRCPAQPDR